MQTNTTVIVSWCDSLLTKIIEALWNELSKNLEMLTAEEPEIRNS